eukprot:GHUV01024627.1.p1 GENE.GHUV01024627.1~~GHUV01024627.1.p1  ORF type:complete len:232 (+),score=15.53 GHUV01024627.1:493-1188(+)
MQSVSMLTRPSAQRQIRIGTRQAPATSVSTHYLTLTPARASTSLLHSSNSSNPQTATASANPGSEEERFHKAFAAAFTMSQLYVKNRPEAVPLSEWEARRKKRDMEDIMQAAKRRSKDPEKVKANLEQLETVLPNLIDLNKMKAADWVRRNVTFTILGITTCWDDAMDIAMLYFQLHWLQGRSWLAGESMVRHRRSVQGRAFNMLSLVHWVEERSALADPYTRLGMQGTTF